MDQNNRGYNKKTITLMSLILIQFVVILVNSQWSFGILKLSAHPSLEVTAYYTLFSGIFVGCTTVFLGIQMVLLANKERDFELNKVITEQNQDLIDVLRSNRHDFSNHLQVIVGFMQLGKTDLAFEYVNEITGKMENQSSVSNIKNLGVAALLLKKQGLAEELGIKYKTKINTDLQDLAVNPSDLARIIGNLIDNAFAAAGANSANPEITVSLDKDHGCYKISVANTGPEIPVEIQSKIFEKGFTTKGSSGSGLGLFIVKELTEKYKGTVTLISTPEAGTTFTISFPVK